MDNPTVVNESGGQVSVWLDGRLRQEATEHADQIDRSLSWLLRKALREYLEREREAV